MQRVRFLKSYKQYKQNEVALVDNNVAFGLTDSGIAVLSKDMTSGDYKQAGDKNGKFTQLRTYKSK